MLLRNWFTEKIILPGSDLLLSQNISKQLNFLIESQWWSENKLQEFQNERLKLLINHAYENVPYYNEVFNKLKLIPADIKTQEDLQKLPIITKDEIRGNVEKMKARNFPKKEIVPTFSSGSTGEPLQYFVTKESEGFKIANSLRGWYWMGYRLGDKYIKVSVMPRKTLNKKIQDFISNCYFVDSTGVTEEDVKQIISKIKVIRPKVLRGYPSTISLVADYIIEENISDIKVNIVATTGENHFPEMRAKIIKAFDCQVYDYYGGEGGAGIIECPTHNFYHVTNEYAITELLSEDGDIVKKGRGEVITTDLWNFAFPLIRYNIKDNISISGNKCPCGRGLSTVDKIEGRDVDILVMPSGKRLIVHFFTGYFQKLPSIKQFQVIHTSIDKITLKLIVTARYDKKIEKKIFEDVQKYVGEDVKLVIKIVENIPLTKAGKRRFVLRAFEYTEKK